MLSLQLTNAGFFPIQWAAAKPGTMYVRPSAHGVLRVFVPANSAAIELYSGSLTAGELRYRGPVPPETELPQWLAGYLGRPLRSPAHRLPEAETPRAA